MWLLSHPRALVYAEAREEAARVIEKTGLLEDQPYECRFPSAHQWDDQFVTCTVSLTYSYESTILIDQSEQNTFPKTGAGEASLVVETEGQVTLNLSLHCSPYPRHRCPWSTRKEPLPPEGLSSDNKASSTSALLRTHPFEVSAAHPRHILPTPSHLKPIPSTREGFPITPFHITVTTWAYGREHA